MKHEKIGFGRRHVLLSFGMLLLGSWLLQSCGPKEGTVSTG